MTKEASIEATVRNIRRKTRRKYTAEENIRIVLEDLRGDLTIAELCRREGSKVPAKQPKRSSLWLNVGSCIRLRP